MSQKFKKQRNRKLIKQNFRNKIINRRYTSTIRTLGKLLLKNTTETAYNESTDILLNNFYSIVDKAVKKGVIHKNTAARKKSAFGKLILSK